MVRVLPGRVAGAWALLLCCAWSPAEGAELVGITITPHMQSENLRWRRPPNPQLGVRAELFLQNKSSEPEMLTASSDLRFDGTTAAELTASQQWAWHDTPDVWDESGSTLLPETLTVFRFNTRIDRWGVGTVHQMELAGAPAQEVSLAAPDAWLSAVTFFREKTTVRPTRMIVHLANQRGEPLRIKACQIWLPKSKETRHVFHKTTAVQSTVMFPADGVIPPGEKGGLVAQCEPLPLTYGVVEVKTTTADGATRSLFAHLRIKGEEFDISGGWVDGHERGQQILTYEPYLKTLKRMHINTGHIGVVPGYTDNPGLYAQYPLKLFNRLQPLEEYDHEEMQFTIHGVEFLGEPQYGGGRPVPPQEVWQSLLPYQRTCLPTTVTHSEERVWRYYAGLSDYPHYDAYRVVAPAADAWSMYDRWGGKRIRWGAPLETIGDLTRSLRELNRPAPIAYWSQGPHHDWNTASGRVRNSPTPDELRAQAYQALANRITSLYWFNLSYKSLLKFPDLITPITRVDREIRLIDQLLLEGDAYEYRRETADGQPVWDLNSVAAPDAAVLFANDLTYQVDSERGVFVFPPARETVLTFRLPPWLPSPAEIFRVNADGIQQPVCEVDQGKVTIRDRIEVAGIYVVARNEGLREQLRAELAALVAAEQATGFDPGGNVEDFQRLEERK